MLDALAHYLIPAALFVLMLIAGTEVTTKSLAAFREHALRATIGTVLQLLLLPLLAVAIVSVFGLNPAVSVGLIILAICPGGGISNYYCYLARTDVLLSAAITSIGTVLSLATIPFWISVLSPLPGADSDSASVSVMSVLFQLIAFVLTPLAVGFALRNRFTEQIASIAPKLRTLSILFMSVVLLLSISTVREKLTGLAGEILLAAIAFILSAMLLGLMLAYGMAHRERPVLVIESAVRNVGIALLLAATMLSREAFAVVATFLTGYFVVEIIIMFSYARLLTTRSLLAGVR